MAIWDMDLSLRFASAAWRKEHGAGITGNATLSLCDGVWSLTSHRTSSHKSQPLKLNRVVGKRQSPPVHDTKLQSQISEQQAAIRQRVPWSTPVSSVRAAFPDPQLTRFALLLALAPETVCAHGDGWIHLPNNSDTGGGSAALPLQALMPPTKWTRNQF